MYLDTRSITLMIIIKKILKKSQGKEFFLGYDKNSPGYIILNMEILKIGPKSLVKFQKDQPGNFKYDYNLFEKGED